MNLDSLLYDLQGVISDASIWGYQTLADALQEVADRFDAANASDEEGEV